MSRNCQTLQRKFRPQCLAGVDAFVVVVPIITLYVLEMLHCATTRGRKNRDPLPPNPADDAPRAPHNECSHGPSIGANAVSPWAERHRLANGMSNGVESTCSESWFASVGKGPATAYQLTKEDPQPLLQLNHAAAVHRHLCLR